MSTATTTTAPKTSAEIQARLAEIEAQSKQAEAAGDFKKFEALRAERFALAPTLKVARRLEIEAEIASMEKIIREKSGEFAPLNDRYNVLFGERNAKISAIDAEISEALLAAQAVGQEKRNAEERRAELRRALNEID